MCPTTIYLMIMSGIMSCLRTRVVGLSTLELNLIHTDLTPQSTSYKTGSIHYDHVVIQTLLIVRNHNHAQLYICSREWPWLL